MEFKTSCPSIHNCGRTHCEIAKQLVLIIGDVAEETGVAIHTVVVLSNDANVKRIAGIGIGQEYTGVVDFKAVCACGSERAVHCEIAHAGDVAAHIEVADDAGTAGYSQSAGADAVRFGGIRCDQGAAGVDVASGSDATCHSQCTCDIAGRCGLTIKRGAIGTGHSGHQGGGVGPEKAGVVGSHADHAGCAHSAGFEHGCRQI